MLLTIPILVIISGCRFFLGCITIALIRHGRFPSVLTKTIPRGWVGWQIVWFRDFGLLTYEALVGVFMVHISMFPSLRGILGIYLLAVTYSRGYRLFLWAFCSSNRDLSWWFLLDQDSLGFCGCFLEDLGMKRALF